MLNIDSKNTRGDIWRLVQRLVLYTVLFALWALAMYYKQMQAVFDTPIKVICEPTKTEVRLYQLPSKLTETGAF